MNNIPLSVLIAFDDVTLRIGRHWLLPHTNWRIHAGENWAIWGPNGAGKTTLAKALMGQAAVVQGRIHRRLRSDGEPLNIAWVSAEQYFNIHRREQVLEEMRHFSGRRDWQVFGRDLIWPNSAMLIDGRSPMDPARDNLSGLFDLLEKPVSGLSTGEMRKLLIARALAGQPDLLILDEPFNGLDAAAQQQLAALLNRLGAVGMQMALITHRIGEIGEAFTHVLQLDGNRVARQGKKADFIQYAQPDDHSMSDPATLDPAMFDPVDRANAPGRNPAQPASMPLVHMRGVNVQYGHTRVLDNVTWTMNAGENWALIGPNGAGKTTLLKLITGDNPQGFANELELFGQRKGSGESVWDIKKHIGVLMDDLQARHQQQWRGLDVVCSGFFDSVGLYRTCTRQQRDIARQWARRLDIEDLMPRCFAHLSYGRQRSILLARAMVKSPRLLIMDEPCNGLDRRNRRRFLALLDKIAQTRAVSLLYVSHRTQEMPSCITHRLHLQQGRAKVAVNHPCHANAADDHQERSAFCK